MRAGPLGWGGERGGREVERKGGWGSETSWRPKAMGSAHTFAYECKNLSLKSLVA